jgi:peptidoglycan/LPS O-acetylase OafA/YrhL
MNNNPALLQGHAQGNLPWLDGLRGIAALWVLLSHIQILSGASYVPLLSWGDLAVDLFMLLSGFLMAHNYIARQDSEPWDSGRTIGQFWLRRFFRIAPLYYLVLLVALVVGPMMGQFRADIASIWPQTGTAPERYLDQGLVNTLLHVSFLFGFSPQYAFRTALPDWSIGLEMQFYLFFPFIMLLMARLTPIVASTILIGVCVLARPLFRDFIHAFPMPAFLLIKFYVFLIGMWIAQARAERSMRRGLLIGVGLALMWMVLERSPVAVARVLMVAGMFYLMNNGTLPGSEAVAGATVRLRQALSNRIATFMGETSYSVYLVHLLIVLPVAGLLAHHSDYTTLPAPLRFGLIALIALPVSYAIGWMLYNSVEKRGIQLGKRLLIKTKPKLIT